jgi:hypothetical protein
MALKIKWTPQADKGLAIVIEYLEEDFLEKFVGKKISTKLPIRLVYS